MKKIKIKKRIRLITEQKKLNHEKNKTKTKQKL